jgi:hypothetical protein
MLIFSVSFQFFRMSPRRGHYTEANKRGHVQDFAFYSGRGCLFPHKEPGTSSSRLLSLSPVISLEPTGQSKLEVQEVYQFDHIFSYASQPEKNSYQNG